MLHLFTFHNVQNKFPQANTLCCWLSVSHVPCLSSTMVAGVSHYYIQKQRKASEQQKKLVKKMLSTKSFRRHNRYEPAFWRQNLSVHLRLRQKMKPKPVRTSKVFFGLFSQPAIQSLRCTDKASKNTLYFCFMLSTNRRNAFFILRRPNKTAIVSFSRFSHTQKESWMRLPTQTLRVFRIWIGCPPHSCHSLCDLFFLWQGIHLLEV